MRIIPVNPAPSFQNGSWMLIKQNINKQAVTNPQNMNHLLIGLMALGSPFYDDSYKYASREKRCSIL